MPVTPKKISLVFASSADLKKAAEETLRPAVDRWQSEEAYRAYLRNLEPGEMVKGEGVFIGTYAPSAPGGVCAVFNAFAAPQDLTGMDGGRGLFTYEELLQRLSGSRTWQGHKTAVYKDENELHQSMADGAYCGQWVVPPLALLSGNDADGNAIQQDNICRHLETGAFKGTFCTEKMQARDSYWSSTEVALDRKNAWLVRFESKTMTWGRKNMNGYHCRPVRFAPRP
jgi:hypothetical protein